MALARSSKQYLGVRAILPPDLQTALRDPTSSDKAYVKGTLWLNTAGATAFMWPGTGSWIALGGGAPTGIDTITGGSGGALSPTAGNINILGTANQITSTGAGSTLTLSLPSSITVPGSLATTTSLTAGAGLTVSTGDITVTTGNVIAAAGAIAGNQLQSGTDITANMGNIIAIDGNLVLTQAGNRIIMNPSMGDPDNSIGVTAAMAGSPGAVTVATTTSSASAIIFYSRATPGGTLGNVSITAQDGTGFTLTSTAAETSTFNWIIFN